MSSPTTQSPSLSFVRHKGGLVATGSVILVEPGYGPTCYFTCINLNISGLQKQGIMEYWHWKLYLGRSVSFRKGRAQKELCLSPQNLCIKSHSYDCIKSCPFLSDHLNSKNTTVFASGINLFGEGHK